MEKLKKKTDKILLELNDVITEIQKEGLQNTQEALDFIDEVNKLSVSF